MSERGELHVAVATLALLLLAVPAVTHAGEITVLCPRAMQGAVAIAAEGFQRDTRHSVWFSYDTTGAVVERALSDEAGIDVVIGSAAGLIDLESRGALRPGTRMPLGGVGIGVAVKAGSALPDISTPAMLQRTLAAAPSLAYADPRLGGQAGAHFAQVLESLGLTAAGHAKTTLYADGGRALDSVAKGQTAMAAALISEIRGASGVTFVGPLPGAWQHTLLYAAGVLKRSAASDVAQAFLAHLRSAAVQAQFEARGIEPAR
jgi:molybdate transport system substrate-binding protein